MSFCWFPKTANYFYPRPPRGGRQYIDAHLDDEVQFLSTPSARRATRFRAAVGSCFPISIHALREEGDECREHAGRNQCISIHALREEGDVFFLTKISPIF